MPGKNKSRRITNGETRRLFDRAGALLAVASLLLALLFASSLDEASRSIMAEALKPVAASPSPAPGGDIYIRLADVDGDVSPEVVIRLMNAAASDTRLDLTGNEPRILIYHTHDTEAYRQTPDSTYEPSGDCRTEDDERNVYAVGEELVRILREEYGITALHAEDKHEKPQLSSAYSRSLETMLRYKALYPTLEMFIDLHRDGVKDGTCEDDFVTVDGLECARLMFVVGTGESGKASQYAPEPSTEAELAMPDFESNYALALSLTENLLSVNDRFTRNIRVKSGKYNQQVSSQCLLVEVGHNGNTLEQAKNSMIYLARAIFEAGGS